jgi:hypothetical protein
MAKSVPWKDWLEWQEVHQLVTSNNREEMMNGLRRIRGWQSRSRVPISVEATGFILGNILNTGVGEALSGNDALVDAQTITRFVNLLTDLIQKGFYAASVEALANSIGIPSWVVQLRHTACHGSVLPRASLLRKALHQLFAEFIIPRYWDVQLHELVSNYTTTNPLNCTEPWSLSTLKHWCNEIVRGKRHGNDFSNIALELEGIYWIITELKDYVIGISDTEAYKQILGVLLSSFISLECRTRLIQLALRYENREIIGCALHNMQTRHIVQALFLQDLGEFKYDQIWIAILTSKASVTNGEQDLVRICRDEPACTGFYYSYDSLVDA